MTEMTFEMRVKAAGLNPKPEDLPKIEAMVLDLDRAAALLRAPRSYADEPLAALRLKKATP